ncbi:hypothetical protein L1F30_10230 [Simiduia sp. 21SJ11W-1]|uniref:hypothetical protein n=1 Tax=Simiduia sp. 21SJ11W-1 TaxID=2909669 RepID=UPI0020A21F0C|nr:hypothetical protein [Simiduia sp. 21SJ11W-1]UTA46549.1 hypothetical protein L1F30_10230 [Simiduia sp. 21SJ11W-1]
MKTHTFGPWMAALLAVALLPACAELKDTGRTIGHGTKDVATAIGHASRDTVKAVGKNTKKVVKDLTEEEEGAAKE